jgi:ribonuclease-3
MSKNLCEIEKKIGYEFKDKTLLREALTHKSCKKPYNNERLEFLGDAVLDLVIGEHLFRNFPHLHEGDLSKMRASLVNEKGFHKLAKAISLGECILISAAEENNRGRDKSSICSNAFEALMGAIYLESGLKEVEKITKRLLDEVYPRLDLKSIFMDYKTTLQEITQAKMGVIPKYEVISATGPDHNKEFEVAVKIDGKVYATAKGKSKKAAHQEAAKRAIEKIEEEKDG